MMGGGFFDNLWDPYSGAYAYPRTQPRARYYRSRPPVYEQRPVYEHNPVFEQRGPSKAQSENHFASKAEEPTGRKTVRTIPVTDGNVPVTVSQSEVSQKAQVAPVVKFGSEDAAATKIQAVYRGYSVRRTEPLKHLRVIVKVKEEFQGFKRKLEDKERRMPLCSDAQERLRWTEGIMALLLRLDQLQGVHPEVRLIRKALTKELIVFQEKLDSLSASEENLDDVAVAEEKSEVCHVEEVADGDMDAPAAEAAEMEVEENMSNVEDADVEEATQTEANDTIATEGQQEAMEETAEIGADGTVATDGQQEAMEETAEVGADGTVATDGQQEAMEETTQAEAGGSVAADRHKEGIEETQAEVDGSIAEEAMEETIQDEADGFNIAEGHQEVMEQVFAPAEESNEREQDSDDIKVTEISNSEQHAMDDENDGVATSIVADCLDQGPSLSETIDESMTEDVEQDGSALGLTPAAAEIPMDVENEVLTKASARGLEEVEVEADSAETVPPMDVEGDHQESEVNDPVVTAPSTDIISEPMLKKSALVNSTEKTELMDNHNQSHDVGRGEEAERLTNEAETPELDTLGNDGDDPFACSNRMDRATDAGTVDLSDGWMIPAGPSSLEPQCCAKGTQVGLPQVSTAADTNSLSDRALLEQLLEENRKLKDVVGKVLHWGKQQNDIIHNLASRIEQLEEHQPQPNMLHGEKINVRKRISNDVGLVGDREGCIRSKGRRNGRRGNRPQLGYHDSEWLSAESDEYF